VVAFTGDVTTKLIAACQAFRAWALAHRPEFGLLFGSPLPAVEALREADADIVAECAAKFSGEFLALFFELWTRHPFPVPADDEIDPGLLAQLTRYRDELGADLPAGAVLAFLRCWVRLYGMVSLEVFGHLHFALDDPAAMFDYTLAELAGLLGLEYRPSP
jgi:hypothetical protein